jgi:prephenate dehydrogenase
MRRINYGTVGIVGLGLVGCSIGLRLREVAAAKKVIGFDQDEEARRSALALGCVDQTYETLNRLGDADILIIAVPTNQLIPALVEADVFCKVNTIVTDTAPVKTHVVNWTLTYPLRFKPRFIGGHPMVPNRGQEPSKDLFQRAAWILTPTDKTDKGALDAILALAWTLGAKPVILSPEEHDRHVAILQHLPTALAAVLSQLGDNLVHPEIAGPAWSRLIAAADADPDLLAHVFLNNRNQIVSALEDIVFHLNSLKRALEAEQYEALLDLFEAARKTVAPES